MELKSKLNEKNENIGMLKKDTKYLENKNIEISIKKMNIMKKKRKKLMN